MTPEEQRIKIAEACGWTKIRANKSTGYLLGIKPRGCLASVPDYLNDLNAMNEAEKVAGFHESTSKGRKLTQKYAHSLGYHTESWKGYATATQRAEAFLRTLNLWKS